MKHVALCCVLALGFTSTAQAQVTEPAELESGQQLVHRDRDDHMRNARELLSILRKGGLSDPLTFVRSIRKEALLGGFPLSEIPTSEQELRGFLGMK